MQLGMVGLGRMGSNMVRRLLRAGHQCAVHDRSAEAMQSLTQEGARGAQSLSALVAALPPPRFIWIMVPAAVADTVIEELRPHLGRGDVLIDGGNTHYHEDIRRFEALKQDGVHYIDVGTSGGVLGLERGYCLMIGGEDAPVKTLGPIFTALAPPGGFLHCGPAGAGHFVKMVHNGIEYGLVAAYAEGLNILKHADAGLAARSADAETTPLANPKLFQYRLDIPAITELWRHGSIITSQLLDLTAAALASDRHLEKFAGHVADSGEGRWTLQAAIEEGVPAYVLSAALYSRFASRGNEDYANKLLAAMRLGFGGHVEKK